MTARTTGAGRAVVVTESMFGNTEAVAAAVADGLRDAGWEVEAHDVGWSPPGGVVEADLLVVGAPTHAFSLSRPSTREDAVRQGADAGRAATGLREWLVGVRPAPDRVTRFAAFDTRVGRVRRLPQAAAHRATRLGVRAGFVRCADPMPFWVEDTAGPLAEGEERRARAWGAGLAADDSRERRRRRPTAAMPGRAARPR